MFVEFYETLMVRERLIGCMDMAVVPQVGEVIEFVRDGASRGAFAVRAIKHDVKIMPIQGGNYFRTDVIATKCCLEAVGA